MIDNWQMFMSSFYISGMYFHYHIDRNTILWTWRTLSIAASHSAVSSPLFLPEKVVMQLWQFCASEINFMMLGAFLKSCSLLVILKRELMERLLAWVVLHHIICSHGSEYWEIVCLLYRFIRLHLCKVFLRKENKSRNQMRWEITL